MATLKTNIVQTDVLGALAYHYECECGKVSQRWERQATAVKNAKAHAAVCVEKKEAMSLGDFLDAATPAP